MSPRFATEYSQSAPCAACTPIRRKKGSLLNSLMWSSVDAIADDTVTDPRGIASQTNVDMLGRTTSTIAAYVDGTPSSGDDQITRYTYDGNGNVLTMTAD